MAGFKKIVHLLNRLKQVFYSYDDEGFLTAEKDYIDNIKNANPYGKFVLIFGMSSFAFGPQYVILPVITLTVAFLTIWTFDQEKEDNPWTFFLGTVLSLTGLYMYIAGAVHILM
ncbi:cell division protein FtsK [Bacillus sp. AFS015802]|nr:cell division protein FtsK [Bacillus sp. AFS015802]